MAMKITIVNVDGSPNRVDAALDLAARSLADAGWDVEQLRLPSRGIPAEASDEHRRLLHLFTLTPGTLIESWRIARHLESLTSPGDTVLLSDYRGFGGMFALEQASHSERERRSVWTLAGASITLAHLDTLGTIGGYEGETNSAIDWELVQYRFSEAVICPARRGVELLEKVGVSAVPMPVSGPTVATASSGTESVIWLPEVVSRTSKTSMIVRSLVSVLEARPDTLVVMSEEDEEDEIWEGTTWRQVAATAERYGARIQRSSEDPGGWVVLGDAFVVPDPKLVEAYASGRRIFAPIGSVAAAMMPQAVPWKDEDSLEDALLRGTTPTAKDQEQERSWPLPMPHSDPDRASKVSVGIPVFRDVRFLDQCLQSVLDQSQPPHELVLFDDGSLSAEVGATLEVWKSRHPNLIRVMQGPNRGVCVARNAMIEAFTGDAFVLVDSDDVLHPDFIEACRNVLRSRPEVVAVATWTEFFGGYEGVEAKPPFDARVGMRENPIISTAVLVDAKIRDDGIRFAPDLAFLYCEDWHLWSQIVADGGTFGLVPRALVRHRVHPSSGAMKRTALAHTVGRARATEPIRPGDLP